MILLCIRLAIADATPLSYEEALRSAAKNNPEILKSAATIRIAEGGLLQAKAIFDPQLTAGYFRRFSTSQQIFAGFGLFDTESNGNSWNLGFSAYLPTGTQLNLEWETNQNTTRYVLSDGQVEQEFSPFDTRLSLNVSQPLLRGFSTEYTMRNLREASRNMTLAELQAAQLQAQILAETARAYWTLYRQIQLVDNAKQSVSIAEEEKRIIRAKVNQGNLAPVEEDRVEAALLAAKSSLIDVENAKAAAMENLIALMGDVLLDDVELRSKPAAPEEMSLSPEFELQMAIEGNFELRRLQKEVEAAEARLKDSQHALLPELSATANMSLSGWEEEFGSAINEMINLRLPGRSIGVNLTVPIANLNAKGEVQQRNAELSQARISYDDHKRNLKQQVYSQIRQLRSAMAKAKLYQANLNVAERTLKTDRALRDAGRKIEKDVLDSIVLVQNAKAELLSARSDYQIALVELARLKGKVFP